MSDFATLREVLQREDTILFLGSGISAWSGLPTWRQMIHNLAEFMERHGHSPALVLRELENNDLLQAASYALDQLTKPQFSEFIKDACCVGRVAPVKIHNTILKLGPRCFITTNYDQLLETALRLWVPNQYFQIVTNKQLTETANIVQARSSNFVFKPHGDVSDTDSIILTREHYRLLYGDRLHALRALETLLVSRPVVFLGFGLRDPDFLLLRDVLANVYKGGVVDHYAIMPAVMDPEREYWRRNYGIHLISYQVTTRPDGSADHSELLTVLEDMASHGQLPQQSLAFAAASNEPNNDGPETLLALIRYSARLQSELKGTTADELPLRVTPYNDEGWHNAPPRLTNAPVSYFVANADRAVLVGYPGAGKSFAFRNFVCTQARHLQEIAIKHPESVSDIEIPFYIDLKLYSGDLWQMCMDALPPGISFEELFEQRKVRVILDSFNEAPRDYLETGRLQADIAHLSERARETSILIGSRTVEGLQDLRWPAYNLDQIDYALVARSAHEHGFSLTSQLSHEVIRVLQKPFFFRLLKEQKIALHEDTSPRTIYATLLTQFENELEAHYCIRINLTATLASVAYWAVENGMETIPASEIRAVLRRVRLNDKDGAEVLNWLIARGIFIPVFNSRLTFFHQSVTEYLAAYQLAKLYSVAPEILSKQLTFTRWDQSLFFTLGFLNEQNSKRFLEEVLDADIALAIRASKYVEFDRDAIVQEILDRVSAQQHNFEQQLSLSWELKELPVSAEHAQQLRRIVSYKNALGGAAAALLVEAEGRDVKLELLSHIFANPTDYNFVQEIAHALSPYIRVEDLPWLIARLNTVQSELEETDEEEPFAAISAAFGKMLRSLPIDVVTEHFRPYLGQQVYVEVLADILHDSIAQEATSVLLQLLEEGIHGMIFSAYLKTRYTEQATFDWQQMKSIIIERLIEALENSDQDRWALEYLRLIAQNRPDLIHKIKDAADHFTGLLRVCLLWAHEGPTEQFWEEFGTILTLPKPALIAQPLHLVEAMELDWRGHEEILERALTQRCVPVTQHLLMSLREAKTEVDLVVDDLEWWLEWIASVLEEKKDEAFWFIELAGGFVAKHASLAELVGTLSRSDSPYRALIAEYVIPKMNSLTTDELPEEAVSFLLADLAHSANKESSRAFESLGRMATEQFVQERLLPLVEDNREPIKSNLTIVLELAGKRHQRRYLV